MKIGKKEVSVIFWFLALLVNGFSLFIFNKYDFLLPGPASTLSTLSWLLSLFLFYCAIHIGFRKSGQNNIPLNLWERTSLILFLAVATGLRLYKLDWQGVNLDEWYWLTQAREITLGRFLSPFGFIGDQPSNLPVYPVALIYYVTHNNYLAARLPGVIYSIATIYLSFRYLLEVYSRKIAWFGLFFMTVSIWDIHNSQIGLQNVFINPFIIMALWYLGYRSIKRLSYTSALFAGTVSGMAVNLMYIALLAIVPLMIFYLLELFKSKRRKIVVGIIMVYGTALLLSCSPTFIKIIRFPQISVGRHQNFVSQNRLQTGMPGSNQYFGKFTDAVQDFSVNVSEYGDNYLWGVNLEPVQLFLLASGLVFVLINLVRSENILTLGQFSIMFIPVVVVYKATSVWREYSFWPSIHVLIALGCGLWLQINQAIWNKWLKELKPLRYTAFIVIISAGIISTGWGMGYYYREYLKVPPDTLENQCQDITKTVTRQIAPGSVVLLPKELCNLYISIFISDTYKVFEYDSYEEIDSYVLRFGKIRVVKVADNYYTGDFQKANNFDAFSGYMRGRYPNILMHQIGSNGKMDAIIYEL